MKQRDIVRDNWHEIDRLRRQNSWPKLADMYNHPDANHMRAEFHQLKHEMVPDHYSVFPLEYICKMKELGITRAVVMKRADCPSKSRKTLDAACEAYGIDIPSKAGGTASKYSNTRIIEIFEKGGKSAVIQFYSDNGFTEQAGHSRLQSLARKGLIDYEIKERTRVEDADLIPPSMLVPYEVRRLAVMMPWR